MSDQTRERFENMTQPGTDIRESSRIIDLEEALAITQRWKDDRSFLKIISASFGLLISCTESSLQMKTKMWLSVLSAKIALSERQLWKCSMRSSIAGRRLCPSSKTRKSGACIQWC